MEKDDAPPAAKWADVDTPMFYPSEIFRDPFGWRPRVAAWAINWRLSTQ